MLLTTLPDPRPRPVRWSPPPLLDVVAQPMLPLAADDPGPAPAKELPADVTALARAIVETIAGRRRYEQLSRWLEPDALSELAARQGRVPALALRSLRAQHVAADAIEVTIHAGTNARSSAVALRVQQQRGRWFGTALEIGPLPTRSPATPAYRGSS